VRSGCNRVCQIRSELIQTVTNFGYLLDAENGAMIGALNTLPTQALFNYYNRTIWNDRLPKVKIRRRLKKGIRALLPKDQLGGCALRGFPYIWVHPTLTGRALKRVLIHEMCHLASGWRGRGHNHRFFNEVIQCPEFVIQYECGKRQTVQLVKRVFNRGTKNPAF
jgi:hypothetical protein